MSHPLVLIGNLHNKRTSGIRQAREKFVLPAAIEISYLDLLEGQVTLSDILHEQGLRKEDDFWLRLDAPGEQFAVERALIALGAPDSSHSSSFLSRQEALNLVEVNGGLYHPSQWFQGFRRFLSRLEREVSKEWPRARWWNAPASILQMMDKRITYEALTNAGIPVPPRLADPEEIPDYETLCERMREERMHRVFIKLAVGSGACGVMAFQINPVTDRKQAATTLITEGQDTGMPRFFNTKKLRKFEDVNVIRLLINWLLSHGAHVERWITKAGHNGKVFDIRQLVVGGGASHTVLRISQGPITNLHLGNNRMSPEEWGLSAAVLDEVKACAEQAVRAFPGTSSAGVDVLLSRHTSRAFIVDVNPFGDLLYDVTYQGWDPYEWEMKVLCQI